MKPAFDRVAGIIILLLVLPVLLVTAFVLRIKLGPGVLIWQDRVGRGGSTFAMCKFRTMMPDRRTARGNFSHADRRQSHKTLEDPRHTPIGRVLRRVSLDELPQLWNVVRGQMSLVGPRPELVTVVEKFDLWGHPRHLVKPGISGPWQLSASRNETIATTAHIDVEYLRVVSLRTDLAILFRTLSVPFRRSGT